MDLNDEPPNSVSVEEAIDQSAAPEPSEQDVAEKADGEQLECVVENVDDSQVTSTNAVPKTSTETAQVSLENEVERLREELCIARADAKNFQSTAVVLQSAGHEEVEAVRREYEDELASLRHYLEANSGDRAAALVEKERTDWLKKRKQLEEEIVKLQSQVAASSGGSRSPQVPFRRLSTKADASMKVEILRLQTQLEESQAHVAALERQLDTGSKSPSSNALNVILGMTNPDTADDESMQEVISMLDINRCSRTDLEMYISSLVMHKRALQEQNDKLQKQLQQEGHRSAGNPLPWSTHVQVDRSTCGTSASTATADKEPVDSRELSDGFIEVMPLGPGDGEQDDKYSLQLTDKVDTTDKPAYLRLKSSSMDCLHENSRTGPVKEQLEQLCAEVVRLRSDYSSEAARHARTQTLCNNYELQLQRAEAESQVAVDKQRDLQRLVDRYVADLRKEQEQHRELEKSTAAATEEFANRLAHLRNQTLSSNGQIENLRQRFEAVECASKTQVLRLEGEYNRVTTENSVLKESFDELEQRTSENRKQLEEDLARERKIIAEVNVALEAFREDSQERQKAAAEKEKSLLDELTFTRQQLQSEREGKDAMIVELQSSRQEVERLEVALRAEKVLVEQKTATFVELDQQMKKMQGKSKDIIRALQKQLEEKEEVLEEKEQQKNQLELKVAEQRGQLTNLRSQLESGQMTQHDLVKLSQKLQIQLAQIEEQKRELRWDHEDEVDVCSACQQLFSVTRRKHHCRQCGKIFCVDCSTKTVPSRGKSRAIRVCDACYEVITNDDTKRFPDLAKPS